MSGHTANTVWEKQNYSLDCFHYICMNTVVSFQKFVLLILEN